MWSCPRAHQPGEPNRDFGAGFIGGGQSNNMCCDQQNLSSVRMNAHSGSGWAVDYSALGFEKAAVLMATGEVFWGRPARREKRFDEGKKMLQQRIT